MAKLEEGVRGYAHPITIGQCKRMKEKGLEAFIAPNLSERAKEEMSLFDVRYVTTAGMKGSDGYKGVIAVGPYNGQELEPLSKVAECGLRVSVHPIYKSDSKIVKTCETVTRKAEVENSKHNSFEEVKSTAKVVTVGGIKYVWLNEKECKDGTEKTMDLVSLDIVTRAKSFGKSSNDYADALDLRMQCEKEALKDCDEEELELLQEGWLSKKENYQSWTPVEMQKRSASFIKKVYQEIDKEELSPEDKRRVFQSILDETPIGNTETKKTKGFSREN